MGSVSIKSVLSLAFAFGLAAFALTASAAPKCSAVYDAATTTLTLYYDEVDHSSEGEIFELTGANKRPEWPSGFSDATTVVFDSSFHNWKPSSCTQWFYLFTKASSFVGIENWDVSECTNMRRLFCRCPVTVLDLSTFETGKCTAFNEMFSECKSLVTIYASANFDTSKGTTFDKMFDSCTKLVGGSNTKFDAANDYKTYARIDLPGQPGYFTGKDVPIPPMIESVDFTDLTHESVTIITKGKNINGGSVTIELWAGEKVAEKSLDDFGSAAFAELTPETTYTVKVTAKNEYGSVTDESCSFTTQPLPVPTISGVTVDTVLHDTVMLTVSGESIADVEVKVELLEGDEIRATKTGEAFGEFVIEGLTPETTYTVKVTATNQYGPSVDESTSFTTLEKPADEWKVVWDDTGKTGTASWSKWKFSVTLAKDGTLAVGLVTEWPDSVYPLDFSLPIKDGEGKTYVISDLSPAFGHHDVSTDWKPAGYEPQCLRVGLLTLPGDGLVTIGQAAFAGCANAIGTLSFPTTLTSFGTSAFANCVSLQIDGSTIPAGVTQISQYCFVGDKEMFGDVVLPNVTIVRDSGFQETAITSATFGPSLEWIGGNYKRGAFQNCKLLTNLVFDAASKARIYNTYTFQDCTALEELDLRGVVDFSTDNDRNDRSHINGCTKLKKIIFGEGLTNLMYNAMAGATALEEVVFEGVPPVRFQTPYLSAKNSKGEHVTGYDNQKVTTYVHRKLCGVKNEAGKCWNDYAANGQIGAAKKNPARNTTWAAEFVVEGVDLANRPLLTLEPDSGLILLVK